MENDTCIHKYIPVFLKHFLSTEPEKPLLIATPFLVLYITWLIHTWHDLFTWVTWLILLLGRLLWKPRCPRSSAWHDSFIRDMPHSSFKRTRLIATPYLILPVTITGESQGGFLLVTVWGTWRGVTVLMTSEIYRSFPIDLWRHDSVSLCPVPQTVASDTPLTLTCYVTWLNETWHDVWHKWNDSFLCWEALFDSHVVLGLRRDMTRSYVTWLTCMTLLIYKCTMISVYCDMTQSHVWYDLTIRGTWPMYVCDVDHSCVWHDSVGHDSTIECVTWFNHTCNMTQSHTWDDAFIRVTWLIDTCNMTHSGRHDSIICVTRLNHVHTYTP